MLRRKLTVVFLLYAFLVPTVIFGQVSTSVGTASQPTTVKSIYKAPDEVLAKIKDEGMNRSQVMQTLSYLTDVIGARLTGSQQLRRANEWTRDTMTKWGMQNAHLEA